MPRFEYFIVAESYSVDRDTSAISIFNVLGKVPCESPGRIPRLAALASWVCEPDEIGSKEEHHIEIIIKLPNSKPKPYRGSFFPSTRFQNIVLDLKDGLEVEQPGMAEVELIFDAEHTATHTFEILQVEGS